MEEYQGFDKYVFTYIGSYLDDVTYLNMRITCKTLYSALPRRPTDAEKQQKIIDRYHRDYLHDYPYSLDYNKTQVFMAYIWAPFFRSYKSIARQTIYDYIDSTELVRTGILQKHEPNSIFPRSHYYGNLSTRESWNIAASIEVQLRKILHNKYGWQYEKDGDFLPMLVPLTPKMTSYYYSEAMPIKFVKLED